jgi:predicted ribosome quality control (RQC) complex YloA/Tae2 family protein
MSLSAKNLQLYATKLNAEIKEHHLSRPVLYAENTLFLHVSGGRWNRLVLALDDNDPRVYLAPTPLDVATLETPFYEQLKKELNNAYLLELKTINDDRVLAFYLTVINTVYKEEARTLYVELIPHHANLILTDANDKVIAAYRPGTLDDERPLLRGLTYVHPFKKEFTRKEDAPFDLAVFEANCLAQEKALADKRKKDRFGYVENELKNKAKLLARKIQAIEGDIQEAQAHLEDGKYGDFIYTNMENTELLQGYFLFDGKKVTLDPARSLSENATFFYKRAKKAKNALALSLKNLEQTKKEEEDASTALSLLKEADETGLENLAKEFGLAPQKTGSLKERKGSPKSFGHDALPFYVEVNGTKILFGKSAKQNDCLTFLLDTAKDHLWFHIEGTTGAHVMIKKENPSEDEILTAAEIALLSAGADDGDVLMAKRGEIRKGNVPGLAIVKTSKTLHLKTIRAATRDLYHQKAQRVQP